MAISKIVQDSINGGVAGSGPAFSAYSGSNTSLTSATWNKVLFDTEEFDTNNNFASSRFTPTVAGYYQINATVDIDAGGGITTLTRAATAVFKNGAFYKSGGVAWNLATGTRELTCPVSSLVYCNGSTDYVEIYVNLIVGSGSPVAGVGSTYTWVNGSMVRSA